jgi:hypothetical protein
LKHRAAASAVLPPADAAAATVDAGNPDHLSPRIHPTAAMAIVPGTAGPPQPRIQGRPGHDAAR